MPTATDTFNRADENPLSGGGVWTNGAVAMKVLSNVATPTTLGSDCDAWYTGVTWGNDQSSSAKLSMTGGALTLGPGLLVRATTSSDKYRLACSHASPGMDLARILGGVYTPLQQITQAWVDGDTWELRVTGPASAAVLKVFLNGALVSTFTDNSTLASGKPGIAYSAASTTATMDDWVGTDVFGGVPTGLRRFPLGV